MDIKIKNRNAVDVYQYYADKAKEISSQYKDAVCLKTDAFNESCTFYDGNLQCVVPVVPFIKAKRTICVEINEERQKRAAALGIKHADFIHGDLTKIDFVEETFDCIFDFSTLDHIHPTLMPGVIANYYKWLKIGGTAVIVTWLEFNTQEPEKVVWDSNDSHQYYFNAHKFPTQLYGVGFSIIDKEYIWGSKSSPFLCAFTCRKVMK